MRPPPDSTSQARPITRRECPPGPSVRAATDKLFFEWIGSLGKFLNPDTLFLAAKEGCQDRGSSAYENNVNHLWRGGWKRKSLRKLTDGKLRLRCVGAIHFCFILRLLFPTTVTQETFCDRELSWVGRQGQRGGLQGPSVLHRICPPSYCHTSPNSNRCWGTHS